MSADTLAPLAGPAGRVETTWERHCPVSNLVPSHKGWTPWIALRSTLYQFWKDVFCFVLWEDGKWNVCRKINSESIKDPTEFNLFWTGRSRAGEDFLPAVLGGTSTSSQPCLTSVALLQRNWEGTLIPWSSGSSVLWQQQAILATPAKLSQQTCAEL